ncbi:MAG: hypothetical protein ABI615_01875 [Chthoniobacterales bacterium]
MEQNISPLPKQPIGRTFTVAIIILGIIALVQIIAAGIKLWPAASVPSEAAAQPTPPSSVVRTTRPVKPHPKTGDILKASTEAEALTRQAAVKEKAGDFEGSLDLLEDADALMPNKPAVIAQMAVLFEGLKQSQNALVQWRRLADMGPAAGEFQKQAVAKLNSEAQTAGDPAGIRNDVGLQPGSTLGIVECKLEEGKQGQKALRIAIKSSPDAVITSSSDVKLNIFFYEKVDGEVTVTTNTRVSSKWLTLPADWADDGMEILFVQYPGPLPSDDPESRREYYGYMAAVYYKGQLQDFRTVPVKLQELFPPKFTLSPQDQ